MPEESASCESMTRNGAEGSILIRTSSMSKKIPIADLISSPAINRHPRLKIVFLISVSRRE